MPGYGHTVTAVSEQLEPMLAADAARAAPARRPARLDETFARLGERVGDGALPAAAWRSATRTD